MKWFFIGLPQQTDIVLGVQKLEIEKIKDFTSRINDLPNKIQFICQKETAKRTN